MDAVGELCTSGGTTFRALIDMASEDYTVGVRDLSRSLYTIKANEEDARTLKEGATFSMRGKTFKAVRPPMHRNGLMVFVCVEAPA